MSSVETSAETAPDASFSMAIDSTERLLEMTAEEVDDLPYGFIILDGEGTILLYNRYEAALARRAAEQVIGRSFFHEVAPCTRVAAFFGRFREVASSAPGASRRFAFRFHFLHGAQDVLVQLTRAPDVASENESVVGARVFLSVVRQKVPSESEPRPSRLTLDGTNGRLTGPFGPKFPLGAQAIQLAFRALGDSAARELGREMGRDVAAVVKTSLLDVADLDSTLASPQLIAGALDDTLAGAGFGRIALDFTEYDAQSLIDCVLRPSIDLPSRPFAAFHEGLLGVAIGTLLDRPLVARCLDMLDLTPTPWLFTLGPPPVG